MIRNCINNNVVISNSTSFSIFTFENLQDYILSNHTEIAMCHSLNQRFTSVTIIHFVEIDFENVK